MSAVTCFMCLFCMDVICQSIYGFSWAYVVWAAWHQGFAILSYALFLKVD